MLVVVRLVIEIEYEVCLPRMNLEACVKIFLESCLCILMRTSLQEDNRSVEE